MVGDRAILWYPLPHSFGQMSEFRFEQQQDLRRENRIIIHCAVSQVSWGVASMEGVSLAIAIEEGLEHNGE